MVKYNVIENLSKVSILYKISNHNFSIYGKHKMSILYINILL